MSMLKTLVAVAAGSLLFANISMAKEEHPLTPEFINGTKRVSAEEVVDLVGKHKNLVIVDSRKASDFQKGYIEGAVSLPNTETDKKSLAKVVKDKKAPILFYCNGVRCGRSGEAAKVAMAAGYKNIYWFRGGIEEWEAKGLPLVHP